jgi:hypothetical protein
MRVVVVVLLLKSEQHAPALGTLFLVKGSL